MILDRHIGYAIVDIGLGLRVQPVAIFVRRWRIELERGRKEQPSEQLSAWSVLERRNIPDNCEIIN